MRARPLLLGVRHHGPGSARAVRAALDRARPAVVLIEGPPEADALVGLVADPGMRPPVALLAHVTDDPARSAFWPFAEFSPEWAALRWAHEHAVPARFIDLPAAHSLALSAAGPEGESGEGPAEDDEGDGDSEEGSGADAVRAGGPAPEAVRIDPLAVLAETAGYDDAERWWEDVVEHRGAREDERATEGGAAATGPSQAPAPTGPSDVPGPSEVPDPSGSSDPCDPSDPCDSSGSCDLSDPFGPFEAIAEAMGALRETYGDGGHPRDLLREAHMRLRVKAAEKEFGAGAVAVVCGAWHVPALTARTTLAADRALLKGLPRAKVEMTWVPWTHRRLSRFSGYGAGIDSPGWYGHLHEAPDRPVERWMTKVAGLLRDEDRMVSSAHVIEAVRLAGTLAVMRGRPLPGLTEATDAVRAVMCEGSEVPLALIHERLVVGEVLGEVPDSAPAVPLQRDLVRLQRGLRLKPEALDRTLELDLRKDTDTARSSLLHRLRLLGVDWGEPAASRGSTGTFRETWRLHWEPELSVRVAEAGVWGTTVHGAATARAVAVATEARTLGEVTALAEQCLPAGLSEALPTVMRALADRAALDTDVGRLAQALPALVRTLRYGDVRGTDTAALAEVATGLAERVFVGLPPACAALDADGAAAVREHVDAVHSAISLLAESARAASTEAASTEQEQPQPETAPAPATRPASRACTASRARTAALPDRWHAVLRVLSERDTVAGVIRGRCARLLLDVGELSDEAAARLMGLALSPGTAPDEAAAWIDGFVGGGATGGGMLLVHDERLLGLVDAWLGSVPAGSFTDVLPLLRRTFSAYEPGVRRSLGELVRRGPGSAAGGGAPAGEALPGFGPELDAERAAAVVPVLRLLLGHRDTGASPPERVRTEAR